ncbi:hypothetical protein KP509_03G022400 [Ceratopteris richardii]|uniref:BURP domain-containing protein n=1 Tax=Ceratopteris richardii TaxID=49495 RepID=A0A8T2V5N2_CERRI|nr:hypothetical protein KP509_03G022400 [Ceratopteris richardii]
MWNKCIEADGGKRDSFYHNLLFPYAGGRLRVQAWKISILTASQVLMSAMVLALLWRRRQVSKLCPSAAFPAMAYRHFELALTMTLLVASASVSTASKLSSYWDHELPRTPMPTAMTKFASPLSDSVAQKLLPRLRNGAPLISFKDEALCAKAGLRCPEKVVVVTGSQPRVCIPPFFNYEYGVLPCYPSASAYATQASTIFFSPTSLSLKWENLPELMAFFGVHKGSAMELDMENTVAHCAYRSEHEARACVTSGEDMVNFITKAMGTNVDVYSTGLSAMQNATVVDVVKVASQGRKVASCHNMKFPSLLFSCHMSQTSELMQVSLKSTDIHSSHRLAICHMDTSYWNPGHIAFQVLNMKPGDGPVCHWFPENSFIFVEG